MIKGNLKHILFLLALSYVFFMLGNGILSLTNPDEVFYAQTAKEMIQQKSWMTPYLFGAPQFEKPILLYLFLRTGFIIFGISSFGARFFPALFGTLGVIAVYFFSLLGFKSEKKAFISALILMSCGLYIGLARTVFTDMIFSIFILFSLLFFYWGYACQAKKDLGILLFFIFSGLAVLTKGPLGFFIPFLIVSVFLLIKRQIKFLFCKYSFLGVFIFIAISFPWYLLMFKKYGLSFSHEFFYNTHFRRLIEAEHIGNDKWYFYPFSIIGCMFPWSLYTLVSLIYLFRHLRKNSDPIYIFLVSWISVVFLIFQPAHSKLVSYIFPLFAALALVTGDFIYDITLAEKRNRTFFIISLATSFILLLIPIGLFVNMPRYSIYLSSQIPVYILILLLLFLSALFCFFIFRYKFLKVILILTFLIPAISFVLLFMLKDIEPYVSSRDACNYLLKNYVINGPIVCSKPFARSVRYYTDREIVVIDLPGKDFFSPHPILFLNSDKKVEDYLRRQSPVYCILKKANVEDIERIAKRGFKFAILKIIGNEYLLKIEPSNSATLGAQAG